MSDVAVAAPAAADSAPAPVVDEQIVDVPNPVETVDQPAPDPKEPAKPPSIREALDKHEKALLAKQSPSVTEIGLAVGFSETSSFTAAFRKITGVTPTAYHRSLA